MVDQINGPREANQLRLDSSRLLDRVVLRSGSCSTEYVRAVRLERLELASLAFIANCNSSLILQKEG